jgi:outer membrane protein TolC
LSRRAPLLLLAALGCSSSQPDPLDERKLLDERRAMRAALPVDGLDGDRAVAIALVHNPELQAWRRRHEIAVNLVLSEGAWRNPELRPSVSNLYSSLGNPISWMLGLRIFPSVPGENDAKVALAEAKRKRVDAEIVDKESRIAAETRLAHARAVMLEEKLRILDASRRLHDRVATSVDRRLIAFAATRLDETLTALKREEIAHERETAAWERDAALAQLGSLLGVSPGTAVPVRRGTSAEPAAELVQDRLEDEALRERPDLRGLKQVYEEREQELRLAHLAHVFWPRFLEPGIDHRPNDVRAELGAAFEIPIFNSGAADIAVAESRRREAREAFAARLHAVRGEIHQATLRLREEERRRRYFADHLEPLLRQAEDLVKAALDAGEADAMKLIAIESRVLEARREAAQSWYEYERARVQLAVCTGTVLTK